VEIDFFIYLFVCVFVVVIVVVTSNNFNHIHMRVELIRMIFCLRIIHAQFKQWQCG